MIWVLYIISTSPVSAMCGQVTPSNAMLDAEYWSATAAGGDSMAGFSHSARGFVRCVMWCVTYLVCDVMCRVMNLVMCCVMHHVDTSPMVTSPAPAPWCRQHSVCYCCAGEHSQHTEHSEDWCVVWCVCTGHRAVLGAESPHYGDTPPSINTRTSPRAGWGDNEEIGLEKMFLFMNGCKNVKISQIVSAFTFPSPNICTINGKVQILPTWNFAGHVNTRYWYSHSAAPMPPTSCFLPLGWGECNDKCRLQARPSLAGFLCSLLSTLSHKWPILGSSWL